MFNSDEIARIQRLLQGGMTAERVAELLDLPLSTFRLRLANSGYRVVVKRDLEKIEAVPAGDDEAVEEAADILAAAA